MPDATPRTVQQGDLSFACESFGDPRAPALLLIMGATASMLWWPDDFCRRLAEAGRFVIRYDNRDTGRTTSRAPGRPDYGMDDMAEDAVAILDGYAIPQAHLVGMSLGGMIAQVAALAHPERVLTLTLVSSSAFDEDDPTLPEMDPALMAHFGTMAGLDWTDRGAVIEFQAESFRISAGQGDFDMDAARDLAAREYDRAVDPKAALNHSMIGGSDRWTGKLSQVAAPALVIHGLHDPILSIQHGRKLAQALNAPIVELDAGHELNPRDRDRMVQAIVDHTAP